MTAPEQAARWRVIHHLLELVNRSGLGEHMVLRGSLLLKAWYAGAAREPGDIDWLMRDASEARYGNPVIQDKTGDFLRLVEKKPDAGGIATSRRRITNVWIDDRDEYAPVSSVNFRGRRLTFPWRGADSESGTVQMDIALDDAVTVAPSWTMIPNPVGESTGAWASPAESLAWKLAWLQRDADSFGATGTKAQGKDLFDAVLLAENTPLPYDLFYRIVGTRPGFTLTPYEEDFPLVWEVDWEPFVRAHPFVTGTAEEWQMRLALALAPTFTDAERERASRALSLEHL